MNLQTDEQEHSRLKAMAARASIATATFLLIIKAAAAFITGSLSVLSSMIDSLSDVVSSCITYVAVRYADKPLSATHRYGYGKAEAVSALIQAAFIVGSACFILYDAAYRLWHRQKIEQTTTGIIIMFISLGLTLGLIALQRYVIKKTKSQAITADSAHYVVDLLANSSVILSLAVVHIWNLLWFDIFIASLISTYLIWNALKLGREALEEITDREVDDNIKQQIIATISAVDGIKGFHDLRTRLSGNRIFIEIHLEFDGTQSLNVTHHLSDKAENLIIAAYPNAQVIIHQDPYGLKEKRIDADIVD